MAMVVKNNMSAVRTLNTLNTNSSALQKSLSKVSSGMKINSAQDDASGYAISERMRVQIRSLDQANQNTQNASSLMKTAEGAVSSTMEILKTLKEKAINAATDTNTDADRATIQKELNQYIDQIDDNALTTFNGKYLVDGSKAQEGQATYTAMTNQSLYKETDGDTTLVALKNRNNESLEIKDTDYITASFVKDGKTYTTKLDIESNTKLVDVFDKLNEQYATVSGNSDGVFGAENTSTTKVESMDSTTAKTTLTSASAADLFKAASGDTSDASAKIKSAIASLKESNALTEANTGIKSVDDAKAALVAELETAYDGLSAAADAATFSVKKDGGDNISVDDELSITVGATVGGNATTLATISGKSSVTTDDSSTTAGDRKTAAGDVSLTTDKDTFTATIMGGVDSVAAAAATSGTYTDGDLTAEVTAATTYSTTASSAGSVASTNLTTSITYPSATTATKAEDYAKAYALDKLSGSGAASVFKSSNIGLNTAGDMVKTADGEVGLTVTSANSGIGGQISGLTLSITDSEGNVKKSANAALDAFKTTIYAKNDSDPNEMTFQVGAAANQAITVGLDDMRSEALGLKGADGSKVSVATQDKANAAVAVFDNAIQKVLDQQATIGAIESRLEYTSQNLTTSSENVQAAESTIRDADMAKEMTNYTKNNVLLQAAQSMLAQANQNSSAVLSLLQ